MASRLLLHSYYRYRNIHIVIEFLGLDTLVVEHPVGNFVVCIVCRSSYVAQPVACFSAFALQGIIICTYITIPGSAKAQKQGTGQAR